MAYKIADKDSQFFHKAGRRPFDYYQDKLEIAHSYGYSSVIGAMEGIYHDFVSMEIVAEIFECSSANIARIFKNLGLKPYGRGKHQNVFLKGDVCPKCGGNEYYAGNKRCVGCQAFYRRKHELNRRAKRK